MNICIVGFGSIGPMQAEALSGIQNVKLYGICDIKKERADSGAEKYGCRAFYDFDECILDENIDFVHICTPHYLHFEMIKKAVAAGKKAVVEKPVVMTASELDELYENFSDDDVFPIVQNRNNACIKLLKNIIDTDISIGKFIASRAFLTWDRDENYYKSDLWRGTKAYEGGGALINQALHTLDLMIYLGGNIQSVSASMSNKSLKDIIEVEDTVDAYLEYENGAKGIFYATNAYSANSSVFIELLFENAVFRYNDNELYKNGERICGDNSEFLGKVYWGAGHKKTFYDIYVNNNSVKLSDIKNTMHTLFSIYESAEKNTRKIKINIS